MIEQTISEKLLLLPEKLGNRIRLQIYLLSKINHPIDLLFLDNALTYNNYMYGIIVCRPKDDGDYLLLHPSRKTKQVKIKSSVHNSKEEHYSLCIGHDRYFDNIEFIKEDIFTMGLMIISSHSFEDIITSLVSPKPISINDLKILFDIYRNDSNLHQGFPQNEISKINKNGLYYKK